MGYLALAAVACLELICARSLLFALVPPFVSFVSFVLLLSIVSVPHSAIVVIVDRAQYLLDSEELDVRRLESWCI